ncbi:MAG: citrate/H+ symporter, CitMHS family, partial [Firmicutes bacterium]|nr:citrate/H+ symporter, CitMHS family [Bacillota bacterium]
GIDPVNLSKALLIGKNYGVLVTPHAATTYLAIGLAGIEIKELFKVAAPWLWFLGILSLFIAVIMGIVVV